jgi:hypothetical protein
VATDRRDYGRRRNGGLVSVTGEPGPASTAGLFTASSRRTAEIAIRTVYPVYVAGVEFVSPLFAAASKQFRNLGAVASPPDAISHLRDPGVTARSFPGSVEQTCGHDLRRAVACDSESGLTSIAKLMLR